MRWEVSFDQFPIVSTFNDASSFNLKLDTNLISSVKSIINEGHGRTMASGISWVRRSFEDKQPGDKFYILTVKREKRVYSLLFKITEGEKSNLVGTYPENLAKDELLEVLYEVLSGHIDDVNLLI